MRSEPQRRWSGGVLAVVVAVLLVAGIGLVVKTVFVGETLASGDGWRIQAKWSPFGSSVSYREDGHVGGAGGLASPGLLTEAISYVPPDRSATYVFGVLPAEAVTVTAADTEVDSSTTISTVGMDRFYLVRIDGVVSRVRLEAVAEDGRVVGSHEGVGSDPSAQEMAPWGPLAVVLTETGDQGEFPIFAMAGPVGRVHVTDHCVIVDWDGLPITLVFRDLQVDWLPEAGLASFEGRPIEPGRIYRTGGDSLTEEPGEWLAEPHEQCPPRRWLVHSMEPA